MTYARARLWLGISCVGTLVLFSILGLLFRLPAMMMSTEHITLSSLASELMLFFLLLFVIIAPFDLLGGYAFPKEYKRYHPKNLTHFFTVYLRGVLPQLLIFSFAAAILTWAFSTFGYFGLIIMTLTLGLFALTAQPFIGSIVSGIEHDRLQMCPYVSRYPIWFARSEDTSFTGGIAGSIWEPKIIIPKLWREQLTDDELAIIIARRELAISTSSRTGGILIALVFLTTGILCSFALTANLSGIDPVSPAGFATVILWNILWSFCGLLFLPTLSRRSSHLIDQMLSEKNVKHTFSVDSIDLPPISSSQDKSALLRSAYAKIESVADDEEERSPWLEKIFHPIPAQKNRYQPTMASSWTQYCWHCLRTYLFLSWFVSGFISRAVHCNVGKPHLWVYLPSD